MHAFLLVGRSKKAIDAKIEDLVAVLKLQTYEFPLQKIEDVRNLIKFTKLAFSRKTGIILTDIDQATHEALNAFLKNLEEPQANLYYILIANSEEAVLPTIASRCQIVYVESGNSAHVDRDEINHFMTLAIEQKLIFIAKLNDRIKAVSFLQNLITASHGLLLQGYNTISLIEGSQESLNRISKNGNVQLQLTNFIINLDTTLPLKK